MNDGMSVWSLDLKLHTFTRTMAHFRHFSKSYILAKDSLLVIEGDVGKLLPPRPVHGVGESRMIGGELAPVREDLAGIFQILDGETVTVLIYALLLDWRSGPDP